MGTTSRWALPYPDGADAADVPADMQALADSLDGVAFDDQGTLASRPVSTSGSPGKFGRWYRSSDNGGLLWRDHGTGYDQIHVNPLAGSFSARVASAQSRANGSVVIFETEDWDVSNWHNVANGRFTPQVAGTYRVDAVIALNAAMTDDKFVSLSIYKNTGLWKRGARFFQRNAGGAVGVAAAVTGLVQFNGSTDYVTMVVNHDTGGAPALNSSGNGECRFQGELVGRS